MRAENAAAALEVMSRFAVDPRWLLYLPPTMAPVADLRPVDGCLEHPAEAFADYRADGVARWCARRSTWARGRSCWSAGTAAARAVRAPAAPGAVYTRTGRPFFGPDLTTALLARVRAAVDAAGLFDELDTDWLLLDAELLPWSAKAGGLIRDQYAAVGAAAAAGARRRRHGAERRRGPRPRRRRSSLARTCAGGRPTPRRSADAYRRYCWPTDGLDGVQLAPFQVLAAEGATFHDRPHDWHLALADRLVAADPELVHAAPGRPVVDTTDAAPVAAATGGGRS